MFENIIRYQAGHNPRALAIEAPQLKVTFERFARDIDSVAAGLAQWGLPPRSVVLISDTRVYIHWLLLFALEQLGHVTVSDDAADTTLAVVKPDAVVGETDALRDRISQFLHASAEWVQGTIAAGGSVPRVPTGPDDPVRIVLSSGTTGRPKQMLSNRRRVDQALMQTLVGPLPMRMRTLNMMGINTGAWQTALTTWITGGTMLYGGPGGAAQAMVELRPNFAIMAPIQLQYLLAGLPKDFARRSDLRIGLSGSATPGRLLQAARARLTEDILFAYAASEVGIMGIGHAEAVSGVPGGTGFIAPWAEVEVVGPDDQPLPYGEMGRLRARTPVSLEGYREPEPDDGHGVFRDGWFYPGDLASLRADGLIILEGREDDVLNLGGDKISAFTVEELVLTDPRFADAAAFTLPDQNGLPSLCAAVVTGAETDLAEIPEALRMRVQTPLTLVRVGQIPRNQRGKIDRNQLKAELRAMLLAKAES